MGTRTFHDFRANSPNQADIVLFPLDDWTLNQVDTTNTTPGPFQEHTQFPYGRHGGFSVDELYVPLIMAGPAFKQGVLLPHPINHADVAPTALAALGGKTVALRTAARGPIHAALAGDPGETVPLPSPPDTARALVLAGSGFSGAAPAPAATPAQSVLLIDLGGVYDEELFGDPVLADTVMPLQALVAQGTRFEDCWTRSRDWPVTEYQLLTGGYPTSPFVAAAEDDPTQTLPPGAGLLAMPAAANHVANQAAYDAWRAPTVFGAESLFTVAHARGMTTALLGDSDFHALHLDASTIDVVQPAPADPASLGDAVGALAIAHPNLFALVALGGTRAGDRHGFDASQQLGQLVAEVVDLANRVPNALVVITSRGATPIDDAKADFYGPGTSRHVPLLVVGPGVRAGVVSGQPATPADIPATILYALGVPTTTDLAQGTWATGSAVGGVPQPVPATATEGHALLRAFTAVTAGGP
jgi:hypothetical protein